MHFALAQYTSKTPTIDLALPVIERQFAGNSRDGQAYGVGLAGINGSGTLNLDIHASGPVHSIRSSEIIKLLNGSANIDFSNVHIAGLDVEHELTSTKS